MSLQRRSLTVRLFGLALRMSNALAGLPNRMVPPPFRLMQMGALFWQSRALHVAARLDLATVLGDSRLSVADIALQAGVDAQALHRLLRLLAAMGVFREDGAGYYRNNRLSDGLRSDRSGTVRQIIMMHNSPELSRPWFEALEQGIRVGATPFNLTHGRDLYAAMDANPEFDALFAGAMEQVEALVGDSFATDFGWEKFGRIIDVGGSKGAKSVAILKRHPHLRALVVDREQTIRGAAEFWAGRDGAQCLPRMRFEVGDALVSVPAAVDSQDVYLLSAVLHGFDDDTCAKALANVAAAAAPTGSLIVVLEMVVAASGADLAGAAMDMQMFVATGGRERTLEDWTRVFDQAGVTLVEIVDTASIAKMLVLRPRPNR